MYSLTYVKVIYFRLYRIAEELAKDLGLALKKFQVTYLRGYL